MKTKIVTAAVIFLAFIMCIHHLPFGKEMDVVHSFSINSPNYKEENIIVILNKAIVTESKERIADNIIQRVLNNDFHTIRFSFDNGYPNQLNVSIYKSKEAMVSGDVLFSFSYKQADGEAGEYDVSQADKMNLEIHE